MNYAETFNDFASKLGPTDLALYAGAGIILWILFKDKLSPVQKLVVDVVNKVSGLVGKSKSTQQEDVFFQLVNSWKQTRDLAIKSNCQDAVKIADQMFPYLNPSICQKKDQV